MPLNDLIAPPLELSDEDKIAQTEKLIERTFNTTAAQLGEVKIIDGGAALVFTHNGAAHTLTWERDRNSAIVYKVDGKPVPGLGGEGSAMRLARWLDLQ